MTRREKTYTAIFLCLLLTWMGMQLSSKKRREASDRRAAKINVSYDSRGLAKAPVPEKKEQTVVNIDGLLEALSVAPQEIELDQLKDPFNRFEPEVVEEIVDPGVSALRLSGIMFEGETPVALINDEILRAGEHIENYKIEDIQPNQVTVTRGEERHILKLPIFKE